MADHGQEMIRTAATTPASMYNGAGTTIGGVPVTRGGDHWWSTAVAPQVPSCSTPEMHGVSAWSAESPRSNSLATASSITFQEPAGVGDPAIMSAGWNQPFLDGSGLSGYMSSRSDQAHANPPSLVSPSSSNNNSSMMLQLQDHHHDQNYQFLSTLGFELLSSPVSSTYGGNLRSSSLLRSLTEPSAAGKPNSPAAVFQRYPAPATCQAAAASITSINTPFWNPSTGFDSAAYAASLEAAAGTPPAPESRLASLATKNASEGVGDSTSTLTKKTRAAPTPLLKKKRTETPPSPLPTFKVRKEKLGDRVTALQQLVSPFGKTDTASVLHETIEYIKFLHVQVGAHSAPYLKNQQQVPHSKSSLTITDKSTNEDEVAATKRDLTGRGLCLVPISSTFAVTSETPVVDFWNPFGAAFR